MQNLFKSLTITVLAIGFIAAVIAHGIEYFNRPKFVPASEFEPTTVTNLEVRISTSTWEKLKAQSGTFRLTIGAASTTLRYELLEGLTGYKAK
jgi:hypothetical protein